MGKKNGLLILGFGGHARSVADVALSIGFNSLLFIDKNAIDGEKFLGFSVKKNFPTEVSDGWSCIPASGNNENREKQVDFIKSTNWPLATLVSSNATIGVGAKILPGCFIGHHVHIGPMCIIGAACIINTGAVVEHDSVVGDFTHISVNATLSGRSQLGKYVFLGASATVIDNIKITDQVIIGAGGVVIKSIQNPGVYVGIPVQLVNKKYEKI